MVEAELVYLAGWAVLVLLGALAYLVASPVSRCTGFCFSPRDSVLLLGALLGLAPLPGHVAGAVALRMALRRASSGRRAGVMAFLVSVAATVLVVSLTPIVVAG